MKLKEFTKKYKKISLLIALILMTFIVMLGGSKLMIYMALLLTGLFLGMRFERFKRMYADYKLGLQVNSILVSQKEYLKQKKELEQLKDDLKHANERINLYKSTRMNNTILNQIEMEEEPSDNIYRNGASGLR